MSRYSAIAGRVCEIRHYLYGDNGIEVLARALRVPERTWLNYEMGVTMPADVMLKFLVISRVDPTWLLTGKGQPLSGAYDPVRSTSSRRPDVVEKR